MRLKRLIYTWGQDPHKSWAVFQRGLVIFIAGAALLFAGAKYWMWLQIPAVLIMAFGFITAAKGYLGIFANRFAKTLEGLKPPPEQDK